MDNTAVALQDAPVSLGRLKLPFLVFFCCALVYVVTLGGQWQSREFDHHYGNHYVHLANSFLHGQFHMVGNHPPGANDFAHYHDRWYVTFPPLPAVVLMPIVALFGEHTPDRLFWALWAALSPMLLFVLLRFLRESDFSKRTQRDDLLLTALFAFGTVFFFTAVQGSVWYAAHVLASSLIILYLLFSFRARKPFWAGLALVLAFSCRPTTFLLGIFFVWELLQVAYGSKSFDNRNASWISKTVYFFTTINYTTVWRKALPFAAPVLAVLALILWVNLNRFDDPFEFGHRYIKMRWEGRVAQWGLFSFHFFPKHFAIFMASLPWILPSAPYIKINAHGLALWFTTPNLVALLWPKRMTKTMIALYAASGSVALLDLCYQNSGWIQFGHRFALDYMPALFVLLAVGGRRFGKTFVALGLFSIIVNSFGAITYERAWQFYFIDPSQQIIFQPD